MSPAADPPLSSATLWRTLPSRRPRAPLGFSRLRVTSWAMAHYCVRCGSQLETRLFEGRELEACPNDDFVLWRDPKVASAVVVETDGGVLLGRRAIHPGYGFGWLPRGFSN